MHRHLSAGRRSLGVSPLLAVPRWKMETMTRFTQDLTLGKSHRLHKILVRVVVDGDGRLTIALRDGERLVQTRLTPAEATNLAAILQTAARVAD